ncbi:hypothetical protein F1D05_13190 [Kribbella qitaiheensis]|uniref:Chromosome segregation ATPase n=1 Tax=Kribbella qitaiheensis TaxID=1544730 RepID=A0A7G6WXH4_9ACTN|nr:hypothetical protein [Kribbella qitaiheensis]QNE18689.1 hypothetical protein F1D05_13190 [Kribbella qitaiheensis]
MSTAQPHLPGTAIKESVGAHGLVGSRELVAVQTFDIARLTNHAIPIVPGTFIAVSGVGPKGDSNGSGKTSFLAAVTVLLSDPQWRLDVNGGQLAAGLLFRPDAAGQEASRVSPAPHGYIVGVFADSTGAPDNLLSLWIRLSTTAPYLQAKWSVGLRIADADTDPERYEQADMIWTSIPPTQRCSAKSLQATLYGDAPRCMAYLDTTLRRTAASLLSQQMTEMSPEAIGQSLIDLAGLRQVLEQEQEQRNALAEQQRAQHKAQTSHELRLHVEDAELAAVANRQRARSALARGELMWRLHFARRYVEITPQHESATQRVELAGKEVKKAEISFAETKEAHSLLANRKDLSAAEREAKVDWEDQQDKRQHGEQARAILAAGYSKIAAERPRLLTEADGWDGTSVADRGHGLAVAQRTVSDLRAKHELAQETIRGATEALQQAERGTPHEILEVMAALESRQIPRCALADTLSIDEPARYWWEPVIHPWLSAVVVAPGDLDYAASAVSHLPGTILIPADGPLTGDDGLLSSTQLPPGLNTGIPIGRFLSALASRHDHHDMPPRAVDAATAGVIVIGGFDTAIAGRQARVATAQAVLDEAMEKLSQLGRAAHRAKLFEAQADTELKQAEAAEQLASNDKEAEGLEEQIRQLDEDTVAARQAESEAFETWKDANLLASQHQSQLEVAKGNVGRDERGLREAKDALKKAQADRDSLHLPYWRAGWANTIDAAKSLLDEQDEAIRRLTAKRLRNRAQEALKEAFDAYHANVEELPADIKDVADHREDLVDGDEPSPGSRTFMELSRPLQTRLDGTAERDKTTETSIRLDRARRQETVSTLRDEVHDRTEALETIQDMIERSIEGHFSRMSAALQALDISRGGYGADLSVVSRRPETATSPWRWQVSPQWRRVRDGKLINYREVANGAQVKVYAVQVTLAALLASDSTAGRVLVIDELGNSLGEVNRKDVLAALRQVAERQRVTILGTCQDSVLHDAAEACHEILWFTHASTADAYNQPVRIWAHDPEQGRVELTADWMRSFRPWG